MLAAVINIIQVHCHDGAIICDGAKGCDGAMIGPWVMWVFNVLFELSY